MGQSGGRVNRTPVSITRASISPEAANRRILLSAVMSPNALAATSEYTCSNTIFVGIEKLALGAVLKQLG